MKYFYYQDNDSKAVVRIKAKRKPSFHTRNKFGTWVIQEYYFGRWNCSGIPEITLSRLNKMIYIGAINENNIY